MIRAMLRLGLSHFVIDFGLDEGREIKRTCRSAYVGFRGSASKTCQSPVHPGATGLLGPGQSVRYRPHFGRKLV